MATYVNNLRLTELATGEGSGTWGTTTNTSLELIGEALGYNTQDCFSSDANATTTVADGATDPARAFYFKVTSSATLTATRTLTIAPNTVSRVMFIENATTGSQSINISQGSGANVTIATGKTAVVYLDGAGSGAAVVDAMAGVDPGVTDTLAEVLVAGNTTGGTSLVVSSGDDVTFTGASANIVFDSSDSALEFADNAKAIFGAGSDLQIYHDGSNSVIYDAGVGDLRINAVNLNLRSSATGENYLYATNNGAVQIYYDGAEKLATTSTGIDVTGTVTADGLDVSTSAENVATFTSTDTGARIVITDSTDTGYVNVSSGKVSLGQTLGLSANNLNIDSSGNVGIGTTSPGQLLDVAGASAPTIRITNTDGTLEADQVIGALEFKGSDASADGSDVLAAIKALATDTTPDSELAFFTLKNVGSQDDSITERMRIDQDGNVGIGTTSPAEELHISASVPKIQIQDSDGTNQYGQFYHSAGSTVIQARNNTSDGTIIFQKYDGTTTDETMRIDSSGNLLVAKTNTTLSTVGTEIRSTGLIRATTNDATVLQLNRTTGTGTVADFRYAGTTVGAVVAEASNIRVNFTSDGNQYIKGNNTSDFLSFYTAGAEVMRIDSSGNVGIGTTGPSSKLHLTGAATGLTVEGTTRADLFLIDSGAPTDQKRKTIRSLDGSTIFGTENDAIDAFTEAMRIDDSGNVGIGTTSPSNSLHVNSGTTDTVAKFQSSDQFADLELTDSGGTSFIRQSNGSLILEADRADASASSSAIIKVDGSEALRVTASGTLLVGKTSAALNTAGFEVASTGRTRLTRDGANVVEINRKTNDGSLVTFNRDGSSIGKIAVSSTNNLSIGGTVADHSGLLFGTHIIYPTEAGSLANGTIALGDSTYPFKDIVLSGTVDGGNGSASAPTFTFSSDTNTGMFRVEANTLGFSTNGAEEMRLTAAGDLHVDGNVIAYSTTISDRRLKSDITNISNALDKVGQINGVTFVRDHNGEKAAGVVAQEIMEVLPEAVKSQALPLQTGEQDQEYYVVEYDAVTGLLVEAVKELKARVEALENS